MSIEAILQKSIVLISSANTENPSFGTGFVFWQENDDSYVLTCAHVIEEVIGKGDTKGNIRIGSIGQKVELIACGEGVNVDLAVLKVNKLPKKMLSVCNFFDLKNIDFQISGFFREGIKNPIIGKNIEGKTKSKITLTDDLLNGWDLSINENYKLQEGYSGSPIIDKETEKVFAIATHAERKGSGGYAISIHNVLKIWHDAPDELKTTLNKVNRKKRINENCQVLVEFLRDRENYYTIQAWLAYPPKEFENIYTRDEAVTFEDKNTSTQIIKDLLEKLNEWTVDHDKVIFEFILPVELFSHHIELWNVEDNADEEEIKSLGYSYPIKIRSQDRFHAQQRLNNPETLTLNEKKRYQKLVQFWKPVKNELESPLSKKIFWLEEANAEMVDYNLTKDYVCCALQFDICNVEQEFFHKILIYGMSISLWVRGCHDFSTINKKINKELFGKKDLKKLNKSSELDGLLLEDLPYALLKLRKKQRAYKNCDYHLTLFWDDKDIIPPAYQLHIPS